MIRIFSDPANAAHLFTFQLLSDWCSVLTYQKIPKLKVLVISTGLIRITCSTQFVSFWPYIVPLISRGKYFSRFLKFFPPTRKNSSLALCHLWGKTMQSLLKNCSFQSFLRVSLENLCKICLILQILLSYSLFHPKTLPKMVNFSKLFPPTLAGIKRNIYPCLGN